MASRSTPGRTLTCGFGFWRTGRPLSIDLGIRCSRVRWVRAVAQGSKRARQVRRTGTDRDSMEPGIRSRWRSLGAWPGSIARALVAGAGHSPRTRPDAARSRRVPQGAPSLAWSRRLRAGQSKESRPSCGGVQIGAVFVSLRSRPGRLQLDRSCCSSGVVVPALRPG